MSGEYILRNTGGNTGNLAFWYSVRRMFDDSVVFIPWRSDVSEFKDKVDVLVIPAANHLSSQWDLGVLADIIECLGKEVLVFGLGAQSHHEGAIPELRDGTLRYLKALSQYSEQIFLRGPFTASVCSNYGVTNVNVMGCPSLTMNSHRDLGEIIKRRRLERVSRIYCAGAVYKDDTFAVEREILKLLLVHPGSSYVVQDPAELIDLTLGINVTETVHLLKIAEGLFPELGIASLRQAMGAVGKCHTSAQAWLESARTHHLSVCTRIHGAVFSLMAGVPTIVVGHDARIRELCDTMLIPWVSPVDIGKRLDSPQSLLESIEFKAAEFDENRRNRARIYAKYLSQRGFSVSAGLSNLAA